MKRTATPMLMALVMSCGGNNVAGPGLVAVSGTSQEIRNGDLAIGPEFSGVGAILETTTHGLCSGSMISNSVVLTAAQCVSDDTPGAVYTFSVLGHPGRGSIGQSRLAVATSVLRHPGFVTPDGINLVFDLALVRLEKPETRRWSDVKRYPVAAQDMPARVHATGVGFGESAFGPGTRTYGDFLVSEYVGSEGQAGEWVGDAFLEIQPGNIKNQMICPGDSGGPLLYNNEIAGVASFRSVATCPEDGPGYQVSTPRFTTWIQDALNELDPPGACQLEDDAQFITSGGGCQDVASGAVWSAPGAALVNQADAAAYCDALVEGGRDDWRLASRQELAALDAHLAPSLHHDCDDDDDDDDDDGEDDHRAHAQGTALHMGGLREVWSSSVRGEHEHHGVAFNFIRHRSRTHHPRHLDQALCVRNLVAAPATAPQAEHD